MLPKYFAEKGSNKELSVQGVVMARAMGCIGFNESEVAYPSDEVLRWAKGYREDHIPEDLDVELVEVTEEMIDSVLGRK
jgi:hypothetical protein